MAINPHDDYEALAKLLYPSIEASGNVYYGQTRKLTMDEILGKNDLGFESHAEPVRVDDVDADYGYHYDNYLCWSIGSLKGLFKVDEFSDNLFAKYKLIITDNKINNVIHSGSYSTYEKDVDLILEEVTTSADLVHAFSDGRNFYIEKADNDTYLYIVARPVNSNDESKYSDENALKLTAVNDSVTISLWYSPSLVSSYDQPVYQYRKNGAGDWESIAWRYDEIELNAGEYIQVRLNNAFTEFSTMKYMCFVFEGSGSIEASGDIRSMLGTSDKQMYSYCYTGMFEDCTILVKAPQLPAIALENYCYLKMFRNCTNLVTAPKLQATTLADGCYESMFEGCTSLLYAPQLPADTLEHACYSYMFRGCSSLIKTQLALPASKVISSCYAGMFSGCSSLTKAPAINADLLSSSSGSCFSTMFYGCTSLTKAPRIRLYNIPNYGCYQMFYGCTSLSEVCIDATSKGNTLPLSNWLYNVSSSGNFYCKTSASIFDANSASGIPSGWTRRSVADYHEENQAVEQDTSQEVSQEDDIREYHRDVMITSGYNSLNNGRGDITSVSTIGNMEHSFDENGTHQMNTYNSDGSFNQEIWGYKSFNSPVQFRNGVYGEDWSMYTYNSSQNATADREVVLAYNLASVNPSIQLSHSYNSLSGSTSTAILSSTSPHDSADDLSGSSGVIASYNTFNSDTSTSVTIISATSDKSSSINCSANASASTVTVTADDIYLNSSVRDNTKIELNAPNIQIIGDYGLASFIDSDTVKHVDIMSCDGGSSADLSCRDRTATIYLDANYTDDTTYVKPFFTVKSSVSESVDRVVSYDGRFEKSSIDLGIYTVSPDNPNVSIQLSSWNSPELYDDWGSGFSRTNKISMSVKSDTGDNLSKIDLNSSSIYLNSDYVYINNNQGSWPAAEFNGNTSVTFNTKVHISKNLFGDIDVGDHGSLKAFYVRRYHGFSISVIAIALASVGNYYICPGDVITYDRRTYGNRTITFTKYNATITVSGATRIADANNIDDVYLAIMTPSGYKNSEFRAMANVIFTILSFARTADSGGAVIYALASMEEGSV